MILQKEIRELAIKYAVPNATIDKDWVLGHVLYAMYDAQVFQFQLIFKGGTAMRKLYYPNYRFSEDLDFTTTDSQVYINADEIQAVLDHASSISGIRFYLEQHKEMLFNDKIVGFQSIVKFWGADHKKNQTPSPPDRWHSFIKIEIVTNETLINQIEHKSLIHDYSDGLELQTNLPCYSITEMAAEKLRATLQRRYTAPRDYFDLWYMINHERIDWPNQSYLHRESQT